jgi:hypothetical protein
MFVTPVRRAAGLAIAAGLAAGLALGAAGLRADEPPPSDLLKRADVAIEHGAAGLSVVARTLSAEQARILAAARGPLVVHVVDLPRAAAAILETRTGPLDLSTGPDPSVP